MSATTICESLVRTGILERRLARSPNRRKGTPHYRLRDDRKAFSLLVKEYFRHLASERPLSWQRTAVLWMGSSYFRHNLTPDLIRSVLSSKGVRTQTGINLGDKREWSSIRLVLPVAPPGARTNPKHQIRGATGALSREQAKIVNAKVEEHYQGEERNIIVPILALLEVSPSALVFFLSKWQPYAVSLDTWGSYMTGMEAIEHVLFRMIWAAVSDLAVCRTVPTGSDIVLAAVGYESSVIRTGNNSILELHWLGKGTIEYYAGFDTSEEVYGEELVVVEKNPGNVWAKFKWASGKREPSDSNRRNAVTQDGRREPWAMK